MWRISVSCIGMAVAMAWSAGAAAANVERGQLLYENHCTVCHTSVAHVRSGRKAHSLADIRKQVLRWSKHLDLKWGADEVSDVVDYLNQNYYQFGP